FAPDFGARKLPVRRRPVRGVSPVPPRELLPLLALPQALGDRCDGAGEGPSRGISAARRSGADRSLRPERGMAKAFCRVCGSSLFGGTWPEGPEVSIRLGVLDDDPGIRPQFRSFVGSKASWDELPDDGLPRFEGRKPKA